MTEDFYMITLQGIKIRFALYKQEAPYTGEAFCKLLPFSKIFYHARYSGQEIWCADAVNLDIIQENASVYTFPGEMVLGPSGSKRVKTANALGVYYGEGRGLDAANIFAKAFPEDLFLLQKLGEDIWKNGQQLLTFHKPTADD